MVLAHSSPASAQRPFYEGKVIRVIVGSSAGGGQDVYARAIARHMGKYVKGEPSVIVENMPGAGTLIAANHLYKVAKPDGLTIGYFIGTVLLGKLLERSGVEFDAPKYEFIGGPFRASYVCAATKASGISSIEQWMASKRPIKVGGTGPGTGIVDAPKILQATLGLPIQIIQGYKGIGDIRLAAESGEVEGICGAAWQTFKAVWRKAMEAGDVTVVLQMGSHTNPELPSVPSAINLAKSEEARQLIKAGIHDVATLLFVYVLAPATPKDRVQMLRQAFQDTLKDPEFLAEAKKAELEISPVSGEEHENLVRELFNLDPGLVRKLRVILK